MKPITLLASICCGIALTSLQVYGAQEPFFEGLGSHTRIITTTSPEAQKYFNQGLNFLFGFNHGAAIRAFQAAEKRLIPTAPWPIGIFIFLSGNALCPSYLGG